jgi:hypothetical protein
VKILGAIGSESTIHRKERENRKRKTLLTHTGLLMEGAKEKRGS